MALSKASVLDSAAADDDESRRRDDPISIVYNIIRNHANLSGQPAVHVSDILPQVLSRGRTAEDLQRCLAEYEKLDVWFVNPDRTLIRFISEQD